MSSAHRRQLWDSTMTVRGSHVARHITASYKTEDCTLEITLQLPASYPLRLIEVECQRRLGIKEDRWRRWVLQIRSLLSTQNGSVLDAVLLWKKNVDREFEGVEPCPICYSVVHVQRRTLPRSICKTCNTKFHSHCLMKWFNSSQKSSCPLCRSPF